MPKIYVPNETKNCYATYFLNGLIYAAIINISTASYYKTSDKTVQARGICICNTRVTK